MFFLFYSAETIFLPQREIMFCFITLAFHLYSFSLCFSSFSLLYLPRWWSSSKVLMADETKYIKISLQHEWDYFISWPYFYILMRSGFINLFPLWTGAPRCRKSSGGRESCRCLPPGTSLEHCRETRRLLGKTGVAFCQVQSAPAYPERWGSTLKTWSSAGRQRKRQWVKTLPCNCTSIKIKNVGASMDPLDQRHWLKVGILMFVCLRKKNKKKRKHSICIQYTICIIVWLKTLHRGVQW